MFNNFVVVLVSLLLNSFIEFEWYESSCSSSSTTTMNTSLGPKFPTMVTRFSGQIQKTLNPNFFSFFEDYCKALSTHATNVALFNSK
jgi:hypothetical protein